MDCITSDCRKGFNRILQPKLSLPIFFNLKKKKIRVTARLDFLTSDILVWFVWRIIQSCGPTSVI